MNDELLDRLRNPELRPALRGYDRLEVDALLHDVADLIEARGLGAGAAESAGELPGVAERVDAIIAAATEAADHVTKESASRVEAITQEAEAAAAHARREADGYAAEKREAADRYADETRSEAEREATRLREEAERLAQASAAAAEQQAADMLREAELERRRVKASVAELRQQRQAVVESIERMRGNLDSVVGGVEQGTEQFIALDRGDINDAGPERPESEELELLVGADEEEFADEDHAGSAEPDIDTGENPIEAAESETEMDDEPDAEERDRRAKLAALFDEEDEEDDEPVVRRFEPTEEYELETGEDDEWRPSDPDTDERPAAESPEDATAVLKAEPESRNRND